MGPFSIVKWVPFQLTKTDVDYEDFYTPSEATAHEQLENAQVFIHEIDHKRTLLLHGQLGLPIIDI